MRRFFWQAGAAQSPPTAPGWSGEPTAGDGQVTLPVDAALETDVVYARFRKGSGAWSAENESWKRTGDGNIVITGLTNEDKYEFILYAKAGTLISYWSDPKFATPTAATVVPTGMISLPLNYLEETIAASAAFQAWVGANNSAEAKDSIHPVSVGTGAGTPSLSGGALASITLADAGGGYTVAPTVTVVGDGTGATATATLSGAGVASFAVTAGGAGYTHVEIQVGGPTRPFCLIDWAANFKRSALAGGMRTFFEGEGDLVMLFRADVDSSQDEETAAWAFLNVIGAIIEDMEELAGTAGYLDIMGIERIRGPHRPEEDEVKTAGDFYEVVYGVTWSAA